MLSIITWAYKKGAVYLISICDFSVTCVAYDVSFHVVWTHFHMLEQPQHVNLGTWEFHVSLWLVRCMHTMLVLVFLVELVRKTPASLFYGCVEFSFVPQ